MLLEHSVDDHFHAMHAIMANPGAGAALMKLKAASGGRLPIVAIFRALAPFMIALIKGQEVDWSALIEAILSLVPAEPPTA